MSRVALPASVRPAAAPPAAPPKAKARRRPKPRYAPPPSGPLPVPWNVGTGPFSKLPAQTRALVAHYFKQDPSNLTLRRSLVRLANGAAFGQLSPDAQKAALDVMVKFPRASGHHALVQKLVNARGFTALDSAVQAKALQALLHPQIGHKQAARLTNVLASSGFRGLPASAQTELLDAFTAAPDDASHVRSLLAFAKNPNLSNLPEKVQARVFRGLGQLVGRNDAAKGRSTLTKLVDEPAFAKISEADMLLYVGKVASPNMKLAPLAQSHVDIIFDLDGWAAANTDQRAIVLGKLAGPLGSPDDVDTPKGFYTSQPANYRLQQRSSRRANVFEDGPQLADRYVVTVGRQRIKVYVPKNRAAGANDPTVQDVAKALARMPAEMRKHVTEVVLEHKSVSKVAMRASVKGRITIYTQDDADFGDRFTSIMVHEAGHHFLESLSKRKQAAWKQAAKKDGKWATFYAGRSMDEDMAETARLYLEVRGTPREAEARRRLSNRFALLDRWL